MLFLDMDYFHNIFVNLLLLLALLQKVRNAGACPKKGFSLQANYTRQYVLSPGYPDPYPRPASCKWQIEATQGDIIVFQFQLFDIEASIFCYKDVLSIIDGHTGFHYELLSMCGSYSKSTLHKTTEPAAIIQFQAVTKGDTKPGFVIAYWTEKLMNAEFGDPDYNVINYILMGCCGILVIVVAVVFVFLYKADVRLKTRLVEEDKAMTQKRIYEIYHKKRTGLDEGKALVAEEQP